MSSAAQPASPISGHVQQYQIRLSHQFLPVKGRKNKRENRVKKSNENDDFSLLKSGPVVCNLLRHSTSSASLFNNFMHRGHKKRKVAGRLVRMWWQVPIQTLIINGGWSEARTRTQSLSPALKKHIAINCHPIFIFCQSVCAARLIPHTKHLWHNREGGGSKRKDMQRYACEDLVYKDHKGSGWVYGNEQRGKAWVIWRLPRNVSLFQPEDHIWSRLRRLEGL